MLGQSRSAHHHEPLVRDDEQAFTNDIVGLATRFGRYGYRRITALLRLEGWKVNHKRVGRIWQREGLRAQHPVIGCHRDAGRADDSQGSTLAHPLGQRTRVHCQGCP